MSVISVAAELPLELKEQDQWVPWRLEIRDGKPTKVPQDVHTGGRASSSDPSTWSAFDEAMAFAKRNECTGVGFVVSADDPFCGGDLDNCVAPETGEIEPWAMEIVRSFDSYTEISPSGKGLRIMIRAKLPSGGNRKDRIELYDERRFFTLTGRRLPGTPPGVEERQEELRRLHRQTFGEPSTNGTAPNDHNGGGFSGDDRELIDRAVRAKNGEKFRRLWAGDRSGYASKSEADLALVSQLAFWTGGDEARIDGLFRSSGLYREKWDRADYRERTIRAALSRAEFYDPKGYGGEHPPSGDAPDSEAEDKPPQPFNLTDLGNAERFVERHGKNVRYCYPWAKWLTWTGVRWERDDAGRAHCLAKETVRSIYREAAAAEDEGARKALAQHATRSEAEARIRAMLELAKSEVPVSPDELDADPWLLNAPNGTVDLRTGELRDHHREDFLTKMAGTEYDPEVGAPKWEAFLERALPSEKLRSFVQRGTGYSATGTTSEQCLFINHGPGANGKTTSQEAIAGALGDYAMRTPTEMLLAKRANGIPNDVARLKGARFVTASETEEGRRLAESLVKDLTGQDTISARFMRAEWFDFKPTHKLWLSTNHKPEIRGTDNAIWRRIRLVPWSVTIPPSERDHKLSEKLVAELPGILAWIVRGCLSWQREGLQAPDEVRKATSEYRTEMDTLAAFIEDRCVISESVWVAATPLYKEYQDWCEESGENAETQRKFGTRLSERAYESFTIPSGPHKARKGWRGIGLRVDDPDPENAAKGSKEGSSEGKRGQPRGSSSEIHSKGQPNESMIDKVKSGETSEPGRQSRPKSSINGHSLELRETMPNEGQLHQLHQPRRLTEEEAQRVQKLVSEGMSPKFARAAVLGEEE